MKILNFKNSMKVALAGFVFAGVGCAKPSGGAVAASLVMTGSSQPTTLANYKKQHPLLQLLSPMAIAFAPPAMNDSTGSVVALNKAWIVVKEVEFKMDEVASAGESSSSEIKFRGPYFVDLLSSIPASFGATEVPVGVYRRIKMKLEKDSTLPADAPTQLAGKSIYMEGTVAGVQFSYAAADGTEFKISGPGGVNLSETANLVIGVKMADLFKMIKLSGITATTAISDTNRVPTANPCPLIDSSAADLFTCFRKGLEKAGKFGCDRDNDGEIEVGEDEVQD